VKRAISILLLLIFALSLSLSNVNLTKSKNLIPSTTTFYDFVANPDKAIWSSGAGALPWPGSSSDARGFATYRTQIKLEDNQTYSKVLETHPQWVDAGWIQGIYPQLTVPTNTKLNIKVGFISGATGSDGVIFRVYFQQGQTRQTLIDQRSNYDSHLDSVSVDLSTIVGKTGNFILYVNAVKGSGQDWAVWASAAIEQTATLLPDLTVSKIYCSADDRITITLANIGSAPLPSGYSGIFEFYVNSVKMGWFSLTGVPTFSTGGGIANPEGTSTYELSTQITKTSTIKVIVDSTNSIVESNETNNTTTTKVEPCAKLPDLTIAGSTCNYDKKAIEFILKNIGAGKVDKPFNMALYVDGTLKETKRITVTIDPGNVYSSAFETYVLTCSNVKIRVVVDTGNELLESDETNNSLEKECKCEGKDSIPPKIIEDPTVINITQNSAVVVWKTDEESDSYVFIGFKSGEYFDKKIDNNLVISHSVKLINLTPGTLYEFYVSSFDKSGNGVNSKTKYFKTKPEEDKEKPKVEFILPNQIMGISKLKANVFDNKGISRVEFYIDDNLSGTDFSPPYELTFDSSKILDGEHSFSAIAYDLSDNLTKLDIIKDISNLVSDPIVDITLFKILPRTTDQGVPRQQLFPQTDELEGPTAIKVSVNPPFSDYYGKLTKLEWYLYDQKEYERNLGESLPFEDEYIKDFSINHDLTKINCNIEVKAYFDTGVIISSKVSFKRLTEREAKLEVKRDIIEKDNYYEVILSIKNVDALPYVATKTTVSDYHYGFEYGKGLSIYYYDYGNNLVDDTPNWNSDIIDYNMVPPDIDVFSPTLEANFSKDNIIIVPNRTIYIKYNLVPILYDSYALYNTNYKIGSSPLKIVSTEPPGTPLMPQIERDLSQLVNIENIESNVDYLIVTNPINLYNANPGNEEAVRELLFSMAEFAIEKNGILGFISFCGCGDENVYRETIKDWVKNWLQFDYNHKDFYLLLVGETEIIPSFTVGCWDGNYDSRDDTIHYADGPYANMGGETIHPEICIGRIIGNDANKLKIPIQSSIDVSKGIKEFCRNNSPCASALVISGIGEGSPRFTCLGEDIAGNGYLGKEFNVQRIQGSACDSDGDRLNRFLNNTPDRDVIIYAGHGYTDGSGWDSVISTSDIVSRGVSFGNSRPFIFAASCDAGRYAEIYGIAEAFLERGAVVYMGATEAVYDGSYCRYEYTNSKELKKFLKEWLEDPHKTLGKAWMERRQDISHETWFENSRYWSTVYQFYGDPKFGAIP